MTTTFSTNSHLLERRKAVPLLLSSFPAPPTHIPPSPLLTTLPQHINPPPSLPPSSPLPPLPGPSPITEHDTLMFISAARARRSSKLSLNSSRRESTATIASIASKSGSCCSLSVPSLDSSSRSLRSFPSNASLPTSIRHTEKHSKLEPLIREEDPSELTQLLDEFPVHSPPPDADLSDQEKLLELAILPPSIRRIRGPPLTTDKPSSSVHIPSPPSPPDVQDQGTSSLKQHHLAPSKSYLHRAYSKTKLNKALPPLPTEPPGSSKRAGSPDIQSILASTPRPRRKSSSSLHSSSQPRSSSRTLRRSSTRTGLKPRKSDSQPPPAPLHLSVASTSRKLGAHSWSPGDSSGRKEASELPYALRQDNGDESFVSDEGSFIQGSGAMTEIADNDEIDRLERELEGPGSDSDSSIDLHTPLPHVMLRDGLLSPHSKLLPVTSRAPSPLSKRPGSLLSVASTSVSVMTKSGVFKDQRDTQQRRTRHRDGRLLRGGLGLTTGLGWSDSEDDDAPSPLTRRLSSLVLARKQSEDSLPTPLSSRSANSPLATTEPSADPPAERPWPRSSLPPTSWTKRTEMRTSTSSNSTGSSAFGRTLRSSGHSEVSSALSRWKGSESTADAAPTFQHNLDPSDAAQETCSSSSASSRSLLLPITPVGSDVSIQVMVKDIPEAKSELGIIRSRQVAISSTSTTSSLSSRSRAQSNSSASSLAGSIGSHAGSKTPVPSMNVRTSVPRPFRLAQTPSRPASEAKTFPQMVGTVSSVPKSTGGVRSRISSSSTTKTGSTTSSTSRLARLTTKSLPSQLAAVRSPSPPPSMPTDRPKPRTGTGMQYRTGGSTSSRPTMIRTPSSGILRTPVNRSSNRDIGVAI